MQQSNTQWITIFSEIGEHGGETDEHDHGLTTDREKLELRITKTKKGDSIQSDTAAWNELPAWIMLIEPGRHPSQWNRTGQAPLSRDYEMDHSEQFATYDSLLHNLLLVHSVTARHLIAVQDRYAIKKNQAAEA